MKYKYALSLHRNARTFIESAVNYAKQDDEHQWQFAILHLTTALELLLKARLGLVDHNQLVAKKAQITQRQFDEGDFISVGIDECIERLKQVQALQLDSRQRQVIKTLKALRNRVAHYTDLSGDIAALKAAAAAGLNLFIEIDNAEFPGGDPYGAKTMPQLVVELHEYEEFVKERISGLSEALQSAHRPRTHHTDECSFCLQDAAVLKGDELQCLFCVTCPQNPCTSNLR